jgi:hypothetical protein
MKYFQIIPLLFFAIGAFFLEWFWNVAGVVILIAVIALIGKGSIQKALKNCIYLIVFTLPVLAIKLFTIQEGMKINLFFGTFYSNGIEYVLNSLFRVIVLSLVSFILFYIVFPVHKGLKAGKYPILDSVFVSFEIYQDILSEAVQVLRNKEKRKNLLSVLDNIYRMGKK